MLRTTLTAALAAVLAGCVSTTPTYQTESAFVIYDVRPASINRNALLDAITQAVQKHMTQVRANRDIPPAELPDKPGRIALKKPLGNSGLATLMAASGQSVTVPTCEGQILTIAASDTSKARYGERTEFFLCVLPYKDRETDLADSLCAQFQDEPQIGAREQGFGGVELVAQFADRIV